MSKANLLQQVDQAFYNQNNQWGLELLREYVASNAKDTEQVYRLAVIEEQIGLDKNAANAYLTCINNDKSFIKAYLYGGYFFRNTGKCKKHLPYIHLAMIRMLG
jgi:hypothetical protein